MAQDTGPLEPAPGHGPIFIVGAMGSGSTLLRLILDSHENIGIPQETGFMRAYNAHQYIPFKWSGRNWARRMGWSREELDRELAAFYDRIFRRYADKHGKSRWGDKTPFHTWHVDDMARLFPEAAFIAIVRHPGGCVGSNMSRWGQTVGHASDHYRRYNMEIARLAAVHGDRFAVVRYEDLVLRPEPVLRELLDWLGEPWSASVLEHHAVQGSRGGKRKVEGRSLVDDPIDVSRVGRWATTMVDRHRVVLRRRLSRLGAFYGYDVDDPVAMAPLREGALLAGGRDLGVRVERFSDLDLRRRRPVPVADRFYDPRKAKVRSVEALAELERREQPARARRAVIAAWARTPPTVRARARPLVRWMRRRLTARG